MFRGVSIVLTRCPFSVRFKQGNVYLNYPNPQVLSGFVTKHQASLLDKDFAMILKDMKENIDDYIPKERQAKPAPSQGDDDGEKAELMNNMGG